MSSSKKRSAAALPPNRFGFGGGSKPLSELAFNKYDRDKSGELLRPLFDRIRVLFDVGSISRDEFRSLCYDMGYYLSDDEFAWAWTIVDKDGSGHVEYREFADWWKTSSRFEHLRMLDDEQMAIVCRLAELFQSQDTSNRGTLDQTQFSALRQALIEQDILDVNEHRACQFEEIDRGRDGRIHFNELIAWFKHIGILTHTTAS
jgi:calcium-binding protein CML